MSSIVAHLYSRGYIPRPRQVHTCSHGSVQLILCALALFDNPEEFIPERYLLSENGTKPGVDGSDLKPTFPFGFGRVSFPLAPLFLC
jgi:hypothetical protein